MKFISSYYDQNTGTSYVTVQHLGKKFEGVAHTHPSEKDYASEFAGCEYAELKAIIKALKYERKIAKVKSDEALDFVKSCLCYKNFNPDDPSTIVVKRQLQKRINRVNKITDEINATIEYLNERIKQRSNFYKKIENKKTKTDNS